MVRQNKNGIRTCRPACRGSASGEFILPAVPDAARTAVVDRRQLTGKMKSTALEKNTTGSASPRRTNHNSPQSGNGQFCHPGAQGNGKRRKPTVGRNGGLARFGLGVGCVEFWISTRVENSAIFGGRFFAWHRWEIALFKGKNRFAVGGVRDLGWRPKGERSREKTG